MNKKHEVKSLALVLGCIVSAVCIAAVGNGCVVATKLHRSLDIAHEKVFLFPLADSTGLFASVQEGAGYDALRDDQVALKKNLDTVLLIEMRRCEKFGYYQMVDDSSSASVHMQLLLKQPQYKRDSLFVVVECSVQRKGVGVTDTFTVVASCLIPRKQNSDSREISTGKNIISFVYYFPAKKIAGHFYLVH